jgi:hypothetical protein
LLITNQPAGVFPAGFFLVLEIEHRLKISTRAIFARDSLEKDGTMRTIKPSGVVSLLFASASACIVPAHAADASLKPEDLLTKHLDAIGSPEARASAKTWVVQGGAVYRILAGGGGQTEGKTGLVSEERKFVYGQASGCRLHSVRLSFTTAKTFVWPFRTPTKAALLWLYSLEPTTPS